MIKKFKSNQCKRGRARTACKQCKESKTRCTFISGSSDCKRCKQKKQECRGGSKLFSRLYIANESSSTSDITDDFKPVKDANEKPFAPLPASEVRTKHQDSHEFLNDNTITTIERPNPWIKIVEPLLDDLTNYTNSIFTTPDSEGPPTPVDNSEPGNKTYTNNSPTVETTHHIKDDEDARVWNGAGLDFRTDYLNTLFRQETVFQSTPLTPAQSYTLFTRFVARCTYFSTFVDTEDVEALYENLVKRCPVLITTCCCISLHLEPMPEYNGLVPEISAYLYKQIMGHLFCSNPNLEFLISTVFVILFSKYLSFDNYNFDTWLISNAGIRHLESINNFDEWTRIQYEIWNNYVYSQLIISNITGIETPITQYHIDVCKRYEATKVNQSSRNSFPTTVIKGSQALTNYARFIQKNRSALYACMQVEIELEWLKYNSVHTKVNIDDLATKVTKLQPPQEEVLPKVFRNIITCSKLFCLLTLRWKHTLCESGAGNYKFRLLLSFLTHKNSVTRMSSNILLQELNELNILLSLLLQARSELQCLGYITRLWYDRMVTAKIMSMEIRNVIISRTKKDFNLRDLVMTSLTR